MIGATLIVMMSLVITTFVVMSLVVTSARARRWANESKVNNISLYA